MKAVLILFVSTMLLASSAGAVDLVCSVPDANVPRSVELCEELRLALRVRTTDWTNDVCATEFLRMGLIEGERRSTRKAFNATVNSAIGSAVRDFAATWTRPTAAVCGDGITDAEFGEECDDGNRIDNDGCSASCSIE